jgi:hypothetical protein
MLIQHWKENMNLLTSQNWLDSSNKLLKIIQWEINNHLKCNYNVGKKKWKTCNQIWNHNFQLSSPF